MVGRQPCRRRRSLIATSTRPSPRRRRGHSTAGAMHVRRMNRWWRSPGAGPTAVTSWARAGVDSVLSQGRPAAAATADGGPAWHGRVLPRVRGHHRDEVLACLAEPGHRWTASSNQQGFRVPMGGKWSTGCSQARTSPPTRFGDSGLDVLGEDASSVAEQTRSPMAGLRRRRRPFGPGRDRLLPSSDAADADLPLHVGPQAARGAGRPRGTLLSLPEAARGARPQRRRRPDR